MYAPGLVHPPIKRDLAGFIQVGCIFCIIAVVLFVGYLYLSTFNPVNGADPRGFIFLITSPLWGGILFVIVKVTTAGLKRQPQEILIDNMEYVQHEEDYRHRLAVWRAQDAPDLFGEVGAEPLAVLGVPSVGTLAWSYDYYFTLPEHELAQHGVILGASGSGKTVTLLRIVYLASAIYGYKVFFMDAKPSKTTAARFLALMKACGVSAAMFPRLLYNGWTGDGNTIYNRLMAIEEFSEPYYKATCKRILNAICKPNPPRSSREFLHRLDSLNIATIPGIATHDLGGVQNRYHAFFDALDGQLDGSWSFDSVSAGYILLDGTSLKEEAASLGRYLVEDFGHYCTTRKPRQDKVLLIIDEYSAISQSGADTANLFERIRESGGAIIVSGQGYASMGDDIERMLDAANFYIVHRSAAPEPLTNRAGTHRQITEMRNFGADIDSQALHTGRAQLTEEPAVHPNKARQLQTGQAIVISHGLYATLQVIPAPEPNYDEAMVWINQQQPRQLPTTQAPPQIAHPQTTASLPPPPAIQTPQVVYQRPTTPPLIVPKPPAQQPAPPSTGPELL
jgi:hypothetical protein